MKLHVVPLRFNDGPVPSTAMVGEAAALLAGWSGQRCLVEVTVAPPLAVAEPAFHFAALGGMTRLGGPALAARAENAAPLVLVAAGPFHPHCWRRPVEAGGGAYAMLPASAPALTAAHELGHLLLGWHDSPGAGAHCLMGGGQAPPGAWLRVEAGWAEARPIPPTATPRGLDGIGLWGGVLVERLDLHLLAWRGPGQVTALALAEEDLDRPVLALLAARGVHP